MPPANNDEPEPHTYPITQAELAAYRRLDGAIRRQLSILAYRRGQIMAGMGGSAVVEPGPLRPQIVYRRRGMFTITDEGRAEMMERHLVITQEDTDGRPCED